jgi:uncharacterized damage-inducible protein DinB
VFTVDGLRKLHNWTHASLNIVFNHLDTISAGDYVKELPGFGFGTLHEQLIHILNCEGLWIHALQKLNYVDRDPSACPELADARILRQLVSTQTQEYLSSLTDQEVNADTKLHFPDGEIATRTPALVLHHVLTHAFHHKGQIAAMCNLLGRPISDTDLNWFR